LEPSSFEDDAETFFVFFVSCQMRGVVLSVFEAFLSLLINIRNQKRLSKFTHLSRIRVSSFVFFCSRDCLGERFFLNVHLIVCVLCVFGRVNLSELN